MPAWLALILGVLQGATEFLPISSSGHLRLVETMFGLDQLESYLLFDITCHLGTMAATCVVLWRDIVRLDRRTVSLLVVASLPLILVVPFAGQVASLGASRRLLGWWFLVSAGLLFGCERWARNAPQLRTRHALCVGAFQVLALLPGVSRSGSTLTAARWMGLPHERAARFCFLLSLPAVVGAVLVQAWQGAATATPLSWTTYAIGFLSAAVVGALTLRGFLSFLERHTLRPFGWYCLILGVIVIAVLS